MKNLFTVLLSAFILLISACSDNSPNKTAETRISTQPQRVINAQIETSLGNIALELYPDQAPQTVANFTQYANSGFYNGTIFHRVIKNFMIQGGGYTTDYMKKETAAPIENEADNGLHNNKYTIAMARTGNPHSATSQFFINTNNNDFLNFTGKDMRGWGYAVFGKVTAGMDVVDKIESSATGSGGPFPSDVPQQTVEIKSIHVAEDQGKAVTESGK